MLQLYNVMLLVYIKPRCSWVVLTARHCVFLAAYKCPTGQMDLFLQQNWSDAEQLTSRWTFFVITWLSFKILMSETISINSLTWYDDRDSYQFFDPPQPLN